MPIQDPNDIRLNEQDDIQAIIGNPPGWTLRWGMTVMAFGIAFLLLIAWIVRYPDVVQARTIITTERPPIRLAAKQSARLTELRVENGARVQTGNLLGVFDNAAEREDILKLEKLAENLLENEAGNYLAVDLPDDLQIGTLQEEYARFYKNFKDLQYFLQKDINYLKISNLRAQIKEIQNLNISLKRQEEIFVQEVVLARKNVERDSQLFSTGALSLMLFEQSQSAYLQQRRQLEKLRSETVQNSLSIRQMEAQILDLRELQSDSENDRLLAIRSGLEALQGQIENWKNDWLLLAPIDGEVVLTQAWSEQQFVKAGEEILAIVPTESAGDTIAKALLPFSNSGKIDVGTTARIRLDGYPYQEFGVLTGEVLRIAPVPGEEGYEVEISLPHQLKTSHDRAIPFVQEMQGTARLITEERSFLLRLLERILGALEEN